MQSFDDVWNIALNNLRGQVSEIIISTWFSKLQPHSFNIETGDCSFKVETSWQKEVFETRYTEEIEKALFEVMGFDVHVTFISDDHPKKEIKNYNTTTPGDSDLFLSLNYDYEYTFDTFIVGESNKFAHAASLAVAKKPAAAYNPLFIYGNSGLGKTHLLFAIANEAKKNNKDLNIIYINCEEFLNELVIAIQNSRTAEFRNKYRKADMLLIDDIQFISKMERTQEEFFHTFNTLTTAKKQIVFTSDRPPREINKIDERLRSRFEQGLLADIQPPDFETRLAILRRKADYLSFSVPDSVLEFIATKLKNNIRQLEGTIKKMKATCNMNNQAPNIACAQDAIKDIVSENVPVSVTVDKIIREVSKFYDVSVDDIMSTKKLANITWARHVAMYIVSKTTPLSLQAIGDNFGGKDHTTIINAIKKVNSSMEKDSSLRNDINDLIKSVKNY
ncbi:MAG: chromosomal replication initiator protein DnaA [Clostridia bacterium]|nr:chromosomal replication initiator protein DnaA [Clostridia bacterium]